MDTDKRILLASSFAVAVMAVGYWLHPRAKTVPSRYSSDIAPKPWLVTLVRTLAILYMAGGATVIALVLVGLSTGRL
jgi:hypothetical protein